MFACSPCASIDFVQELWLPQSKIMSDKVIGDFKLAIWLIISVHGLSLCGPVMTSLPVLDVPCVSQKALAVPSDPEQG